MRDAPTRSLAWGTVLLGGANAWHIISFLSDLETRSHE